MRHEVKIAVANVLMTGGAALVGVMVTLGVLAGGSFAFAGGAAVAIAAATGGSIWWNRLMAAHLEDEIAARYEANTYEPEPRALALPEDVEDARKKLEAMVLEIGHKAADILLVTKALGSGMADVADHLVRTEDERDHYRAEAGKVGEAMRIFSRPARGVRPPDAPSLPARAAPEVAPEPPQAPAAVPYAPGTTPPADAAGPPPACVTRPSSAPTGRPPEPALPAIDTAALEAAINDWPVSGTVRQFPPRPVERLPVAKTSV